MADSAILEKITACIVNSYQPLRVILYGSAVDFSRARSDSDLDLILIKDTEKRFVDRIGEVLRIVRDIFPKPPLHVLVYTPAEFEEMKGSNTFVKKEVIAKGRVIYDRSDCASAD